MFHYIPMATTSPHYNYLSLQLVQLTCIGTEWSVVTTSLEALSNGSLISSQSSAASNSLSLL